MRALTISPLTHPQMCLIRVVCVAHLTCRSNTKKKMIQIPSGARTIIARQSLLRWSVVLSLCTHSLTQARMSRLQVSRTWFAFGIIDIIYYMKVRAPAAWVCDANGNQLRPDIRTQGDADKARVKQQSGAKGR